MKTKVAKVLLGTIIATILLCGCEEKEEASSKVDEVKTEEIKQDDEAEKKPAEDVLKENKEQEASEEPKATEEPVIQKEYAPTGAWKTTTENGDVYFIFYDNKTGFHVEATCVLSFSWEYNAISKAVVLRYNEEDWKYDFVIKQDGDNYSMSNDYVTFSYLGEDTSYAEQKMEEYRALCGQFVKIFDEPYVIIDDDNMKIQINSVYTEGGNGKIDSVGFDYSVENKTDENYLWILWSDTVINNVPAKSGIIVERELPYPLRAGKSAEHCRLRWEVSSVATLEEALNIYGSIDVTVNNSNTTVSSADYNYVVEYDLAE